MEDSRAIHKQRQEVNFDYINTSRYEAGGCVRARERIKRISPHLGRISVSARDDVGRAATERKRETSSTSAG